MSQPNQDINAVENVTRNSLPPLFTLKLIPSVKTGLNIIVRFVEMHDAGTLDMPI
jgi:hypothetical protein